MMVSNDDDGELSDDPDTTVHLAEVCSWVIKVAYRLSMGFQLPNGASLCLTPACKVAQKQSKGNLREHSDSEEL
ncbi:hypothetical protein BHE74_00004613 [Ensete ventricosum]|nr:hypothetical protein GW17_00009435 [Ensete ventricosum]RWW86602.1 hypothetical protein BHE74_00004613 [Ensete ventricosum]RZR82173.1 hypothetical protein BHM03_00008534 [Ensete ventricosum]